MGTTLSSDSKLFDYFDERVKDAREDLGISLGGDTSLYLTNLLVERARADRPRPTERTLAELHARAANEPPQSRARTYRELGDRSLYLVGYFRESLDRTVVGPRYYADMGAAAYHQVDQVMKTWFADAFGEVFTELAGRFRECVAVLDRIRAVQDSQPDQLARWYEEWLRTGDEETAERLRRRGLLLPGGGPVQA